jgi:putrescine transport system ATP-binding protein
MVALSTPAPSFLQIEGLTKRFDGVAAVDTVSITIDRGEIFALLGSSGCGKSTLLRMLAGFETPTEGRIVLEGEDISRLPPYVRPINMMFQSYALFPHLTVWENVAFGLKRQGIRGARVDERVEAILNLVQLKPYSERKPHQLSGGQQQRVALARSLALEPKLLLLDEPLGALDRKLREQTQFELKAIIKRVGVTCVMVTHDQEEAMTMADRIAVMSSGKFLQVGAPRDIYEAPSNRFVADFIGNVNLFDGKLEEDQPDHCTIRTPQGSFFINHGVVGLPGTPMSVAVRPEKVMLRAMDASIDAAERNVLEGTVAERAYFGSLSLYRVQLASGALLQVSVSNADRYGDQLAIGASVRAIIDPEDIVVLTA